MHITFSIDFDGGSWPGPLAGREAVVGEAWVGPGGLLGLLETALGLRGPSEPAILRVARLIPSVQSSEGFWSESAEHNPLAAAHTLLAWRDELWMAGWRGQALTPRLGELARVTAAAAPGFPDRLQAVHDALRVRPAGIEQISLVEPRDELATLWREALAELENSGTRIVQLAPVPATPSGDLAAVQADGFSPRVDGSLQLLRPYGPQAAAEAVAAWLASREDLSETVVIGGDPLLDAALARHGLPCLGATANPLTSTLLQLLPLTLSLGWDPPDPQLALELLTSSLCPLPAALAGRLASALAQWPAVGSPAWERALEEGLAAIEGEIRRERIADRVALLFDSAVPRSRPYSRSQVERRVELLSAWSVARAESDEDSPVPWWAILQQGSTLLGMIEGAGLDNLTLPQLERFVQAATRSVDLPPARPTEAGLAVVPRPGAIVGPARHIVWWSFDQESAPAVHRLPLSRATEAALAAEGIELEDPGRRALALARRWRRPLLSATESLLLVCPQTSVDGEDLHPHPLWDELVGRFGQDSVGRLEVSEPVCAQAPRVYRPEPQRPPAPRTDWQVAPALLGWRERESPSSLASLIGCSLRWALQYHARLERGRSLAIPGPALVLGNLLHETVEKVLLDKPATPATAREAALEYFEEILASRAAALLLPGAESEHQRIRRAAGEAACHLCEILAAAGLEVEAAETTLQRPWFEGEIGGRIDLLVGEPAAVIDLKLGGARGRRQELKDGTADALAIYSHLLAERLGTYPPVAFYILLQQTLLTVEPDRFPGAEPLEGPKPAETWEVVDRTARKARANLAAGVLVAAGVKRDPDEKLRQESEVVDGLLERPAPCGYCDFAALCGRLFEGELP